MAAAVEFFVVPAGNDQWSGLEAEPAGDGQGGPFATLERARLAVAALPARGKQPVQVWIRGGVYALAQAVNFGPGDSGGEGAQVSYAAWGDEQPVFDGGKPITNWRKVEGQIPGLPAAARAAVWMAEVPPGWNFPLLYCSGKPLPVAASTLGDDWEGWPRGRLGDSACDHLLVAATDLAADDPGDCATLNWLPTPYTFWSNSRIPVQSLASEHGRIGFAPLTLHMPQVLKQIPWRLENVISGLTAPGRWFLDFRRGRLYLWPPEDLADPNAAPIVAPFASGLINVRGSAAAPVQHLAFRGLAMVHTNLETAANPGTGFAAPGAAITLSGVEHVRLEGLIIEHLAGNAIHAAGHVRQVEISGCTIAYAGGAGVIMGGGLALPEAPCARNVVCENLIHDIGQLYWHSSAVALGMSEGSLVRNNEIHHLPYTGITSGGARHRWFEGWPREIPEYRAAWEKLGNGPPTIEGVKILIPGNNRIEFNLVHHAMMRLDDGAAIYCHAGHGNRVSNNIVYAGVRDGSMGLYFDDEELGSTMESNIVYRVPDVANPRHGSVVHLHNNARNVVRNNILIGVSQVFSFARSYGGHRIEGNVVVYRGKPGKPASPAAVGGASDGRRQADWNAGPSVMDRNLFWCSAGGSAADALLERWQVQGLNANSMAGDPRFLDADHEDFRLAADSPALREIGFVPIDATKIGRTKKR